VSLHRAILRALVALRQDDELEAVAILRAALAAFDSLHAPSESGEAA
jgi:hypothetical protein